MSEPIPHPKVFASSQTPPWGVEVAGDGFWLTPPQSNADEAGWLILQSGLEIERSKVTISGIKKYYVFCGAGRSRHLPIR